MRKLGTANLDRIYAEVETTNKAKSNPNWKAKVCQTLQYDNYLNPQRGTWAIAA